MILCLQLFRGILMFSNFQIFDFKHVLVLLRKPKILFCEGKPRPLFHIYSVVLPCNEADSIDALYMMCFGDSFPFQTLLFMSADGCPQCWEMEWFLGNSR